MSEEVAKQINACPGPFSDHVYATKHGVDIPLRIWPAPQPGPNAPWLLWIHGGGFTAGRHYIPNAWVIPAFLPKGYHVVSIAYRYAPQVGIDDILEDCASALAWCQQHLPQIVGSVDAKSYVVGGDSAGGSLSTLCGHLLRPRPKAVIDIYGVVDFLDPYYSHGYPNPEYIRKWPEGYLETAANDRDPAKAVTTIALRRDLPPNQTTEELQIHWGTDYTPTDKDYEVNDMYRYMGSTASLMSTLFRKEKYTNDEYDVVRKKHSPLYLLETEEGKQYPPTFILHGTSDSAVLIAQSHAFVEALKKNAIDVGYVYTDGAEHCFDDYIDGPDHPGWTESIIPLMKFIEKHLE